MEPNADYTQATTPSPMPAQGTEKASVRDRLLCGWPLVLLFFGGFFGGFFGAMAWGINEKIYKSSLPIGAKVGLIILTGLGAIVVYVISGAVYFRYSV